MGSHSEKQAEVMRKIALGIPVEQKYSKIKPEHARTMHAEDVKAGVFFHPDGRPKYNPAAPRSKEEMEADANA